MRKAIFSIFALTTLAVAAGGCTVVGGSSNWHPPRDAVLFAETPEGNASSKVYGGFKDATDATLYLYDVNTQRLLYTGLIRTGDVVRLYADRALVMPLAASTQPSDAGEPSRYAVAQYPAGAHVRAYVLRAYQGMTKPI